MVVKVTDFSLSATQIKYPEQGWRNPSPSLFRDADRERDQKLRKRWKAAQVGLYRQDTIRS